MPGPRWCVRSVPGAARSLPAVVRGRSSKCRGCPHCWGTRPLVPWVPSSLGSRWRCPRCLLPGLGVPQRVSGFPSRLFPSLQLGFCSCGRWEEAITLLFESLDPQRVKEPQHRHAPVTRLPPPAVHPQMCSAAGEKRCWDPEPQCPSCTNAGSSAEGMWPSCCCLTSSLGTGHALVSSYQTGEHLYCAAKSPESHCIQQLFPCS